MAVIITDMDMPSSCMDCPFTYLNDEGFGLIDMRCDIDDCICTDNSNERRKNCPLKSADEMMKKLKLLKWL